MTTESDEILKVMQGEVKIEPGAVLSRGETPTIIGSVENSGRITVYDTETGEPSNILYYMKDKALAKKRPNGNPYFSLEQKVIPKAGNYKCLLHARHPRRDEFEKLGFSTCPKDNLRNEFQVRRHMLKRHPQEWATIEEERERKERKEDREFQRTMMSQAGKQIKTQMKPNQTKKAKGGTNGHEKTEGNDS
jgi:hypothetical protein